MGTLQRIWIKRSKPGPMDAVERAEIVAGRGLVDNANQGGRRQITLLSAELWSAACTALGGRVDPSSRRANLLVQDLDLADCRGKLLRVGSLHLRVLGETRPCERMDAAHAGLRAALDPPWFGGAFAEAIDSGSIRVSDPVDWI